MLYIKSWAHGLPVVITWQVGEVFKASPFGIKVVEEVRADDKELRYILNHMPSLPYMVAASELRWFGDHAKFIVANLK